LQKNQEKEETITASVWLCPVYSNFFF